MADEKELRRRRELQQMLETQQRLLRMHDAGTLNRDVLLKEAQQGSLSPSQYSSILTSLGGDKNLPNSQRVNDIADRAVQAREAARIQELQRAQGSKNKGPLMEGLGDLGQLSGDILRNITPFVQDTPSREFNKEFKRLGKATDVDVDAAMQQAELRAAARKQKQTFDQSDTDGRAVQNALQQAYASAGLNAGDPTAPLQSLQNSLAAAGFAGQGIAQPTFAQLPGFNPAQTPDSIRQGIALESIGANVNNSVFGAQTNQRVFDTQNKQRRTDEVNSFNADSARTKDRNTNAQLSYTNALNQDSAQVAFEQQQAMLTYQRENAIAQARAATANERNQAITQAARLNSTRAAYVEGPSGDLAYALSQNDFQIGAPAATIHYAMETGGQANVLGQGIAEHLEVPITEGGFRPEDVTRNPFSLIPGGKKFKLSEGEAVVINGKTYAQDPIGWLLEHPQIGGRYLGNNAEFYEEFPEADETVEQFGRPNPGIIKPDQRRAALQRLLESLVKRDLSIPEHERLFQNSAIAGMFEEIKTREGLTAETFHDPRFSSTAMQESTLGLLFPQPNAQPQLGKPLINR